MAEPQNKANGFLVSLRVIREMAPDRVDDALAALPAETMELVRRPPLPATWIPARRFSDLLETAHRTAFRGDLRLTRELARRVLLGDLATLYKVFIRLFSAEFALARAAKIYGTYTRDNGRLDVTRTGDHFAELTYTGVAHPSPVIWAYYEGAIRGVMDATKLRDPDTVALRGGGGEPDCTFRATWK